MIDFLAMEANEDVHEEHERELRHEDGEYVIYELGPVAMTGLFQY